MKTLKVVGLVLLLAMGIFTLNSQSHADIIAYDVPAGAAGNQSWTGSLGMDFDTNQAITVTQLGVFDSGQDGIPAGITLYVAIFNRDTENIVGSSLSFTQADAGNLVNGSFFKPTSISLAADGHYSIVAWGYNGNDPNGNASFGGFSAPILHTGGGAISFVGQSRYSSQGTGFIYPDIVDIYAPNTVAHYNAGTFAFVPIPASALLLGSGLMGLGLLGWRRKKS